METGVLKGGGGTVVREKMSMVNGTREGGLAVVMKPMCKTVFCTVDCNVYRL